MVITGGGVVRCMHPAVARVPQAQAGRRSRVIAHGGCRCEVTSAAFTLGSQLQKRPSLQ